MYEEVKAYLAAVEAAGREYASTLDALGPRAGHISGPRGDCPACANQDPNIAARRAAVVAFQLAQKTAWDALKASQDPLVRWIAENCGEFAGSAVLILEALPAPMEALDAIADMEEWCGEWNDFRQQAADAGVLPSAKTEVPA